MTFVIYIFLACGPSNTGSSSITYRVFKGDHAIIVDGSGEIEAKKSYSIVTPMLNWQQLKIAYLVPEGTYIKEGDIVVQLESEKIENNYIIATNELQIARAEAKKREVELELERLLLESRVKSLDASVAVSRLRLKNLTFEPVKRQEIEKLDIKKNEIELRKLKNKLTSLESIQKEERARFQLKIKQEAGKRDQAKNQLEKLTLKAPVDGIMVYLTNWWGEKVKEGDQKWPNEPIAEIPDLSVMQVSLKLGETEAQKCKEGQKAVIAIYSMQDLTLNGTVSKVNKVAKPISRGSKIKRVEVLVELDSNVVSLSTGISAKGQIIIKELSDVFAIPFECIFEKDSLKIVYIYQNGHYDPYTVMIQQQDDDFSFVTADIENGSALALREPRERDIRWSENWNKSSQNLLIEDSLEIKNIRKIEADSSRTSLSVTE